MQKQVVIGRYTLHHVSLIRKAKNASTDVLLTLYVEVNCGGLSFTSVTLTRKVHSLVSGLSLLSDAITVRT